MLSIIWLIGIKRRGEVNRTRSEIWCEIGWVLELFIRTKAFEAALCLPTCALRRALEPGSSCLLDKGLGTPSLDFVGDSTSCFCPLGEVGPWICGGDDMWSGGITFEILGPLGEGPWRVSSPTSNHLREKCQLSDVPASSVALLSVSAPPKQIQNKHNVLVWSNWITKFDSGTPQIIKYVSRIPRTQGLLSLAMEAWSLFYRLVMPLYCDARALNLTKARD